MKDVKIKTFVYNCKCGYSLQIFLDSGIPQEKYKCRKCSTFVQRIEL